MMEIDDNTPLPVGAIRELPVRARNVLHAMDFPKTYGGIRSVTEEMVLAQANSGRLTTDQIMAFREKCLNGAILPERPVVIPRADDELPPLAVARLSVRTRNVLNREGIAKTPRGVCALDRDSVRAFAGAGKVVAEELMALKARCLSGDVWTDEIVEVGEEEIRPDRPVRIPITGRQPIASAIPIIG